MCIRDSSKEGRSLDKNINNNETAINPIIVNISDLITINL